MPKQRLVKFRGYNDGLMIMDDVLEFFLLILFMIHRGSSAPLECRQTPQGRDYAGYLNVTRSGLACQSWSSQTPHAHSKYTTASEFVDTTVAKASNFCRNPANARADHPWCYTMGNVVTEICTVVRCPVPFRECKVTVKGFEYRGTVAVTKSGYPCQTWTSQSPHGHMYSNEPNIFPDETVADAKNFCRNLDDSTGPWCYTKDPNVRYELCDIPFCGKLRTVGIKIFTIVFHVFA